MKNVKITLAPVTDDEYEQFITDNQFAFKHSALYEFGERDNHIDCDGEIISRNSIEKSINAPGSEIYHILYNGEKSGGVVLNINTETYCNHLELLFVSPSKHSKGIGYATWKEVEALHPETLVWETYTPYFDKRNIHFYVNKCGFQAVEFLCEFHKSHNGDDEIEGPSDMFRFIKVMKKIS